MITYSYKKHRIHENFNEGKITVQYYLNNEKTDWVLREVKTFLGAKRLITKFITMGIIK